MRRLLRLLVLSLCSWISFPALARAQNWDLFLTGISQIVVVINGLTDQSRLCGITAQSIEDSALFPVSGSRLKVVKKYAPSFVINVTTLRTSNGLCFSSLYMELSNENFAYLDIPPGDLSFVKTLHWQYYEIMLANSIQHPQQVRLAIENAAKKFVTEWNLGNKQ